MKKTKRKAKAKPKKKVAKKARARKPAKQRKAKVPKAAGRSETRIQGVLIGHVTHYFPHVNAAVVKIKKGILRLGDRLQFKGHTTDFIETLVTIEIDHSRVQEARPGDEVGLGVHDRVREGDAVYRLA